ncbi:MAG: hypothetical protein HQL58_13470 [Magnetococcales bacterium]|nr:hypothetical protein [Magnetococcales bacterium]
MSKSTKKTKKGNILEGHTGRKGEHSKNGNVSETVNNPGSVREKPVAMKNPATIGP